MEAYRHVLTSLIIFHLYAYTNTDRQKTVDIPQTTPQYKNSTFTLKRKTEKTEEIKERPCLLCNNHWTSIAVQRMVLIYDHTHESMHGNLILFFLLYETVLQCTSRTNSWPYCFLNVPASPWSYNQ